MYQLDFDDPTKPPNIVIGQEAANIVAQNGGAITLLGFLGEVLVKAACAYPTWKFEIQHLVANNGTFRVARARIFNERGENVGDVWKTSYIEIGLTNQRIKKAAQRGNARRTSKLNTALSLIKKFCTEPSLPELLREEQDVLYGGLNTRQQVLKNRQLVMMNAVKAHLTDYIIANIDLFFDEVPSLSSIADKKLLLDTLEHSKISTTIKDAPAASRLTVVVKDDKYVLQRAPMPIMVKTSEQLPEDVRMKIGMLKLVENGQFIQGVGYRHSPTSMLIIYTGPLE